VSVRRFKRANEDSLSCSIGACNITGAVTMAVLVRPASEGISSNILVNHDSSFHPQGWLSLTAGNKLELGSAAFPSVAGATSLVKERWYLLVATKASGAVKPKYYIYDFTAATWHIEEAPATEANWATQAGGKVAFGTWETFDHFDGEIAAAAEWNVALSEAEVKALQSAASLEAWKSATTAPKGLWLFNQAVVTEELKDLTEGAANQVERVGTEAIAGEPPIPYKASGKAVLPLGPANGAASTSLALHVSTVLPLGPAEGKASTALALHAPTRLPLGAANGAAPTAMVLTTPTRAVLPLGPAAGAASTSLALRAPPHLVLIAAGAAQTSMVLSTPTARRVVVTREHPPSRLSVLIKAPDGTPIARWAQDESKIENVISGLTKDGEMPGGHKEMGCVLARDPKQSYPDLALFNRVEVQAAGGEVLWSGTLRQMPESDGDHISIEPKAAGDMQFLEDDEEVIGPGFISKDQSTWGEPTTQRRIDLLGSHVAPAGASTSAAGAGASGASPALIFDFSGTTSTSAPTAFPGAEMWFDGGGVDIGWLAFDQIGDATTPWSKFALLSTDDRTSSGDQTGNYNGIAESTAQFLTATAAGRKRALFQVLYTGTFEGQLVNIQRFANVVVAGTHGLPLQGEWPNVGYLAKQMIPFIAELAGLTTVDELLEDDGFIIPQAWFAAPATPMSKLVEVTKYGLLDWFVFQDRILQYRFPGTFGRTWLLGPGNGPKNSGADAGRVYERIMVTWQDVDGTTKMAGAPGSGAMIEDSRLSVTDPRNAALAAGVPRGKLLALNGVCVESTAVKTAQRALEDLQNLAQSGEVTLTDRVQEVGSGAWYPVSYVQPGDRLREPATGAERKVTSVPYSDEPKSADLTIGAPPEGEKALEERFNAKLIELGLGS
jgi:hypothetical protein